MAYLRINEWNRISRRRNKQENQTAEWMNEIWRISYFNGCVKRSRCNENGASVAHSSESTRKQ